MNDREHDRKQGRVHGRVRVMDGHVHGPCTAVYTVCTWPWTAVYMGRKHGRVQCTRPCTRSCTCTLPCTVYTGRKHGRVQVHDRLHGRVHCTRPCLRLMYTVHGRVYGPCTGPPMYRVHDQGRVQIVYTTMHGPCTWSGHDTYTAVYGCAPCTRACLRPVYTAVY